MAQLMLGRGAINRHEVLTLGIGVGTQGTVMAQLLPIGA